MKYGVCTLIAVLAIFAASVAQAGETGFFPTRPSNPTLHKLVGVLTEYGVGQKSGQILVKPTVGAAVPIYVASSMKIDGTNVTCLYPPTATWTPAPSLCSDWPKTLIVGTTSVTVTYWTTSYNGKTVKVSDQIDY
jgi:hypothetical protein